jgi:[CysO sulfur-carrier protein]-S-L-cysteine hydrolase
MGRRDLRPVRQLRLTTAHYESMRAHLESCLPFEGCGVLAGTGRRTREVLPVANEARSEVSFRMDPAEQLRAFAWIDSHDLVLRGIFHSHPAGPQAPSSTDIAEAAYPVANLIWSHAGGAWKVRGFWIADGRISAVKLYFADGA